MNAISQVETKQLGAVDLPWSARRLREAYQAGADAFGWKNRDPKPRSMRVGRELVGYGMARGTYGVVRTPSETIAIAHRNGTVAVQSSGIDIGTGTYTILAQTAAEVLGIPTSEIRVRLGDTNLPRAPMAGGSQLANLLTSAVHKAVSGLRDELIELAASHPQSPLARISAQDLHLVDGRIKPKRRPDGGVLISELLQAVGEDTLAVHRDTFKAARPKLIALMQGAR